MIMRYLFWAVPFLLLSCQQKEQPPISKEKMVDLVMDLHLAEVYSSIARDSVYSVSAKKMDSLAGYYKDVLHHHNISQDQYAAIVNWYKINPQELDSVYAKVIPRLSELEARYSNDNTKD
jgi:hypothetical protein